MKVQTTELDGVFVIEPRVFSDSRGFFFESYHRERFRELGIDLEFVQDNHSRSHRNVLRGLHYQIEQTQGKLCRVVVGEVFDVAVDLRRSSKTFGRWTGVTLSEENRRILYVPPGFAHGFYTLSESAHFLYKCTDYYAKQHERTIIWNDPTLGIDWPTNTPLVSEKDTQGVPFDEAETYS